MLLTKKVEIKLNNRTKNHYRDLGYDISKNPIELSSYLNHDGKEDSDKIICLTTGKTFKTRKEACEYYKIKSKSMISDCLSGRQRTTTGFLKDGTKVKLEWSRI